MGRECMTQPVVVWAFTDGKAGHENQTRGLLAALAHRHPVDARLRPQGPAAGTTVIES